MTTAAPTSSQPTSIRRLLVANRGEIARRVFTTCARLGIETVAVYSEADAEAPFVAQADYRVALPGSAAAATYLRGDLIVDAARRAGADAIHPGYGFLSESAEFARAVIDAGVTWVGPLPETIEQMGSKVRAKELMRAAGVPTLDIDLEVVTEGDFPLLVKASAGGGGRGMRVVRSAADLHGEIAAAQAEAASAFGDGTVFVEPYLPTARHIEVQVMADRHGTCWILGERDCSLQRRHQKVLEETPAPLLPDGVRQRLFAAARAAVAAVDYRGAGTVEFLVKGDSIYFLEMNTRLQVEHPVTECVTGQDLVELQLRIAEGAALDPDGEPRPHGYAVEVRVYAEDPAAGWAPQTGRLRRFETPAAAHFTTPASYGVRCDAAVEPGSQVGVYYDPMLAKIIAWAADRESGLRILADALRRSRIHGLTTNSALLREMLQDEEVRAGAVHTSLLDQRLGEWVARSTATAAGVLSDAIWTAAVAAAIAQAAEAGAGAVQGPVPAAWRSVPSQPRRRGLAIGDRHLEVAYQWDRTRWRVVALSEGDTDGELHETAGPQVEVVAVHPGGDRDAGVNRVVELRVGGVVQRHLVWLQPGSVDVAGPAGSSSFLALDRLPSAEAHRAAGSLVAPMPGVITDLRVGLGESVRRGDTLLVLEAMKMQHVVAAPADGAVTALPVAAGAQVAAGEVLAVVTDETNRGPDGRSNVQSVVEGASA